MKRRRRETGHHSAGRWRRVAAAIAATIAGSAGAADLMPDALSLMVGDGSDVTTYTVGAVWKTPFTCPWLADNNIDVRVAGDIAYWAGQDRDKPVNDLVDVSVTPLLHWSPRGGAWQALFVEAGIGLHLLSHTQINQRRFSTAFQFGERLVVGVNLGGPIEIGGYLQHVSNADIKQPNDGITQWGVMLRMLLR